MNVTNRVIFYDLETTGLKNEQDKIIEIGAKDNMGNIFNKLINPKCDIPIYIEKLTGITKKKVLYRHTIEQAREQIKEWFDFENENIYLIAHNGDNFDIKFLQEEFNIKCKQIDTLKLFRKLIPQQQSHSIKTLCNIYNIDCSKHHRALDDVIILEQLFMKAIELYKIMYNVNNINIEEIYSYIYN